MVPPWLEKVLSGHFEHRVAVSNHMTDISLHGAGSDPDVG
jgi:hypothetical protein